MKKWLISLCCLLIAGVIGFVFFLSSSNSRVDALNKDLGDVQADYNNLHAEYSALKEKSEEDQKTIESLNLQIGDLTAENSRLSESLDHMNRNLSSSQEKLQSVMYILTDGTQGSIDSILSPYVKIYQDVPVTSAYFDAVRFVTEKELMKASEEDVFGVFDSASLQELADGLYRLQGKEGTAEEALASMLKSEQAWIEAQSAGQEPEPETVEEAETAEAETESAAEPETEGADAETDSAADADTETIDAEAESAAEPETEASDAETEPAADAAAEEPDDAEAGAAAEPETDGVVPEDPDLLTRERLLTIARAACRDLEKAFPEITLPESGAEKAFRGDLALVLMSLAQE